MTHSSLPSLSVRGLTLSRGPRRLFADLKWDLDAGSAMVLRGPNGCGKTTLLRVIAGLTRPESGEVRLGGAPWKALNAEQRRNCLYLGHSAALKEELSVDANLSCALDCDAESVDADALAAALAAVGLGERRHLEARRLSQGQKRRVGLARLALSAKPMWLLDEPTNALDAEGVALFLRLVERHLGAGGMACIATHLPMDIGAPVREIRLGSA
ncbi:MAG TPA: heme ABC exporter ATP-binding protein CcmA [Usitatibacteraceae bacterium]|nr:heme ABC exporter ATP-binding protein CcmA [Usitatibacteraceae bacterium]